MDEYRIPKILLEMKMNGRKPRGRPYAHDGHTKLRDM
jgi:hypothetical protein